MSKKVRRSEFLRRWLERPTDQLVLNVSYSLDTSGHVRTLYCYLGLDPLASGAHPLADCIGIEEEDAVQFDDGGQIGGDPELVYQAPSFSGKGAQGTAAQCASTVIKVIEELNHRQVNYSIWAVGGEQILRWAEEHQLVEAAPAAPPSGPRFVSTSSFLALVEQTKSPEVRINISFVVSSTHQLKSFDITLSAPHQLDEIKPDPNHPLCAIYGFDPNHRVVLEDGPTLPHVEPTDWVDTMNPLEGRRQSTVGAVLDYVGSVLEAVAKTGAKLVFVGSGLTPIMEWLKEASRARERDPPPKLPAVLVHPALGLTAVEQEWVELWLDQAISADLELEEQIDALKRLAQEQYEKEQVRSSLLLLICAFSISPPGVHNVELVMSIAHLALNEGRKEFAEYLIEQPIEP